MFASFGSPAAASGVPRSADIFRDYPAGKRVARGSPAEYGAGMKLAIESGWLWMHESGTYVKFTPADAEL